MIEINGLTFRYGRADVPALDALSLTVREGSLFGLLGPNASGKTTLISILAGLLRVPSGMVRVGRRELNDDLANIQATTAFVPQEYAFYPSLTVGENLDFFAGVQRLPTAGRADRIGEALETAGLERMGTKRAATLSGGMKRRLNLAIGLLNRPRILLLDEPTVGIDPQSRAFILDAVTQINKGGTTVVYTTHYMEEVEAICDRIGVLDSGRLVVQGSLAELLAHAHDRRLRADLAAPLTTPQQAALARIAGLTVGPSWLAMEDCDAAAYYRVHALLQAEGIVVARVQYGHGNLEQLFLTLTKRHLRDS